VSSRRHRARAGRRQVGDVLVELCERHVARTWDVPDRELGRRPHVDDTDTGVVTAQALEVVGTEGMSSEDMEALFLTLR
jgi:hypothetical protein